MRKSLFAVGVAALLALPLTGSASAGGDEPELTCKTVYVKANVGADANVEKKITLRGKTLADENIDMTVFRVVKTVAVTVCVGVTGDVVLSTDAEAAIKTAASLDCGEGMTGLTIDLPLHLEAGVRGGSVDATITLAVSDEDVVADTTLVKFDEVFKHEASEQVDPLVVDDDSIHLDACVEAGTDLI